MGINDNYRIIGFGHKDNLYLGIIMFIIIFLATIIGGIVIFIDGKSIYNIIFAILFWLFSLGILILAIALIVIQLKTKKEIILYDANEHIFILNLLNSTIRINSNDIIRIEYCNKGISSLGFLLFPCEMSYGKIFFILNDGIKIKTPLIDNIIDVYHELNKKVGLSIN